MKIFITSDNHLGFAESDAIRGEDSFNTFREILEIANSKEADMILQGGDLFHYSCPSRNTYNKTLKILSENCLGTQKEFGRSGNLILSSSIYSENNVCFKSNVRLNRDSENMFIKMPIISIHGNHDDPSGLNSVSPINILESAGFINYVGRIRNLDEINIEPILLEKRGVKIALFPLGYIKDRRLYKAFKDNKVRFERPIGKYYCIFLVHQNRTLRNEEYLPEEFIPTWFDLVIYGHEHASVKVSGKHFEIIQVGSSVRTSLSFDETGCKYAYLLDLTAEKQNISRIPLKTVRGFVMDTIKITESGSERLLIDRLSSMLDKVTDGSINNMLPLLRIRIEMDSNISFEKYKIIEYVKDRIANLDDFIKIIRKRIKVNDISKTETPANRISFTDIFLGNLKRQNLMVLPELHIQSALSEYVEKMNKNAFNEFIYSYKNEIFSKVNTQEISTDEIEKHLFDFKKKYDSVEKNYDC